MPRTVLRHEDAPPPPLPAHLAKRRLVAAWWATWRRSPQAEHFGSTDWQFLLETAEVAAIFFDQEAPPSARMSAAAELRLRVAKFGATPEDRARLRMQFAQADEADAKRPAERPSRERYGKLRVLPPGEGGGDAVAGA